MVSTYIFSSKANIWEFAPKPGQFFSLKKSVYTLALHRNIFTFGTLTKRQVLKRFKTSGFKTSETSGLQNVRFTKRQVYTMSGL